ncbi:hypothetical protein [Streptomyces sp. LN549]|uniref:hypothetical protein n=1 Tax=Streptomyces sp. LN549 TaxID=3112979 RepID=UPI003716C3E2
MPFEIRATPFGIRATLFGIRATPSGIQATGMYLAIKYLDIENNSRQASPRLQVS